MSIILKTFITLLMIASFIFSYLFSFAQETTESGQENSSQEQGEGSSGNDPSITSEQDLLTERLQERERLEEELKKLEEEIAQYEKDITRTQAEKKTLQSQIYILKNKIKKLDLQIQQSNMMIKDLGVQVEDTKASIDKTTLTIEESREKLAEFLKLIYEEDQKSLVEILLEEEKLSVFFNNLIGLEALCDKSEKLLEEIKKLKGTLEEQRESLDEEKGDLENLLKIQLLQKGESQTVKKEQEGLLEKTKGQEVEYQKLLTERKERVAQIRSRIFELIGVPEAPTFGQALDLAKEIEKITGVRPAFLLAVMTQESQIGKNVGQCYLPKDRQENLAKRIMAPGPPASKRDDVAKFLELMSELGRDPYTTPVSCPMQYGWGGAMGPAQFIPTTWADPYGSPTGVSYKRRVEEITGKTPADPWNIRDAFFAAALYLSDYGAKSQTESGEWRSAMIYFSGSTNKKYRFYGDSVLRIAKQYEEDIKELETTS